MPEKKSDENLERKRSSNLKILLLFVFFISGCAPVIDYHNFSIKMAANDCAGAKKIIDTENYGSKNRLLYLMDSGILHMHCKDYKKAIDFFGKASDLGDELWTESVSAQTASFFTNDLVLPYSGEDFERVMLPLFSGLCYMKLRQYDDALVDFKRLDIMLGEMSNRYDSKNIYREDALARYLGGLLYESFYKHDDAFIDYYRAFSIYQDYARNYGLEIPRFVAQDLVLSGKKTGRTSEVIDLMGKDFYSEVKLPETSGNGKVVFITFAGSAPRKYDDRIILPSGAGPITVAFPVMRQQHINCKPGYVEISGQGQSWSFNIETAEDINAIAIKNLDDRKARYIAKAIARAAAKQVAIHQISRASTNHNPSADLLKILLNIGNMFLEQADTRSWSTLPGEILVSVFYLPEGKYKMKSFGCKKNPDMKRSLNVKAGATVFVVDESSITGF